MMVTVAAGKGFACKEMLMPVKHPSEAVHNPYISNNKPAE